MSNEPAGDARSRRLREPLLTLAAIVLAAIGIALAGTLSVLVAFSGLAAIVCRRAQLWFLRRGLPPWAALTVTVGAFGIILIVVVLAAVASAAAVAVQLAGERDQLSTWLDQLRDLWASTTGVPAGDLPGVDASAVISFARSLATPLVPIVTTLAMAVLIVTYLLLDADHLHARMLRATSAEVVARYDTLASELVTYVRVRAVLGAAAALADTVLLLVLGVPYAILWGVISFLFSFVPNIGFVLALVPPTAFALLEGGLGPAVAVVVGYVVINLAFDYVLQPRMMASSLDLSPVVVIVTILVWSVLIGPAGALLAVPLTIVLRAILLPFPGARWFLALLGPIPASDAAATDAAASDAAASDGPAPEARPLAPSEDEVPADPRDPTIRA
jgi:AI-2 transport protein TqsA